jgi:hypothetical protein
MGEVLASGQKDISAEYARGFQGMKAAEVPLPELLAARKALVEQIAGGMPDGHRQFLISFERGKPDWSLLGVKTRALPKRTCWHVSAVGADATIVP